MTQNFKHSIELEGRTFTRNSPRNYTHVVVGRVNIKQLREYVAQTSENDQAAAIYYAEQVVGLHAATSYDGKTTAQRAVDAGWTSDAFVNLKLIIEQRVAATEKKIASGAGQLEVLQWSMSEKNARSGARTFSNRCYSKGIPCYLDIAVLPVTSRL